MKFRPISNITEIGETPIKQVSETKFLGIIIDDKLTCKLESSNSVS